MLRIGIVGLGNAASMILPALRGSPHATLGGAADLRSEARTRLAESHDVPAFASIGDLLRAEIDAVWIATPNQFHAEQAVAAAKMGKHIICEKPMAMSLSECDRMIEAADANKVKLLLGHSKLMQAPILKMREVVESGVIGDVLQIATWNYNDWLQRPRLAAEVDTSQGGGICYRQAPHQVDIVRYIMGRPARSIRAVVNRADPRFPTEGNFTALLTFEAGRAASLVYNAYGYFDGAELTWGIGEGGRKQVPRYGRKRVTGPVPPEVRYGRRDPPSGERHQPIYGLTIATCERGVVRQSPDGVFVYDESGCREVPCEPEERAIHRDVAELAASIAENRAPFPDGHWGKATLEVCLALIESARSAREIPLVNQS